VNDKELTFERKGFYPFDYGLIEKDIIQKFIFDSPNNAVEFLNDFAKTDIFSCLHINCRSVIAHHSDVDLLLHSLSYKPSVYVLTETCLSNNSLLLPVNNYLQYNRVRPNNQRGGAVSLLVHSSISSSDIAINSTTFEYLCRQLVIDYERITCVGVYKPPMSDCTVFFEEINELLSCISNKKVIQTSRGT
jgi:hypothetical protein